MKIISIPRIILYHPNKYLLNKERYDILGSILLSQGYTILEKMKFPSELKIEIQYFTKIVRSKMTDTELTIKILELDQSPQKEAVRVANQLLEKISIQVKIVD